MRVIFSNGLVCDSNDYLSHHGILGQKWGKQNGPPYPLGGSDHSAAEKKAGWKKSLDNDGRTIDKKLAKKNYKNAKEELSDANHRLNYAKADLKGNQLLLEMSKKRLQKLEAKGKAKKIAEERKFVADFEKYVERSKLSVEYAKAVKEAVEKDLSIAKEELDIAKAKKTVESYSVQLAEQKFKEAEDHFKEIMSRKAPSDEEIRKAENARDKARRDMESAWVREYPDQAERNNAYAYDRAKNKDRYEMDFLEAIQNKNYLSDNKNRRLAEYKEYLQDREKYWQNRTSYDSKDNIETMRKLSGLSDTQRKQAEAQARKQSVQNYTRVKSMLSSGMTYAQIAKKLGISESTVWAMIFDEE